jgi:hypothetical protein
MSGLIGDSAVDMPQEQMDTPLALQRLWSRRTTLPEESELGVLEDLFPSAQVSTKTSLRSCRRRWSGTETLELDVILLTLTQLWISLYRDGL